MTDAIDEATLRHALDEVGAPGAETGIVSAGMVSGLSVRDGHVRFVIEVDPQRGPELEPLRQAAEAAVAGLPGVDAVTAILTAQRPAGGPSPASASPPAATGRPASRTARPAAPRSPAPRPRPPHQHVPQQAQGGRGGPISPPGIRHIIAVASGKGGVGKSTLAVNLAVALAKLGLRTGLLDADVYGPSQPKLLGAPAKPKTGRNGKLQPIERHGIKAMSIGYLVDDDRAMIWRGPMVVSALEQMLRDVDWGELDVLVVDMPPGTGDAQLTMAQRVALAGAVIVSTPQDIALIDAQKGIAMFQRVEVPILGVVENMSYFVCPDCGGRHDIFGHGGAQAEAGKRGVPFLGEIPLHLDIRTTSDAGTPIVAAAPDSAHAAAFRQVAEQIAASLAGGSAARPAPRIVVVD
jgi:ATP-binding protein involved in chromosome partitioning